MERWVEIGAYVGGWLVLTVFTTALARRLDRSQHPLRGTTRMVRGLLLPAVLLYLLASRGLGWHTAQAQGGTENFGNGLRTIETLAWLAGILVALSAVTNTALMRREGSTFETRYPKLRSTSCA